MIRALKRDFILNWRFFGMPPSIITIQAQVYNILKQNICGGVYKPGQRLLETELAASLKVSRSPVREAMRKLATEGLVEEFPTGAYSSDNFPMRTSTISSRCGF